MALNKIQIVGAGLSGLATALHLSAVDFQSLYPAEIEVLGPNTSTADFAGGQPVIATHPHFSKDHNGLSQWTSFCVIQAESRLHSTQTLFPNICIGRGRWQIAQSKEEASHLQVLAESFNSHVPNEHFIQIDNDGNMFWPSAWIIDAKNLQRAWLEILKGRGVTFTENQIQENNLYHSDHTTVLCNPALVSNALPFTAMDYWPGATILTTQSGWTERYGATAVKNKGYSIATQQKDQWLQYVNDDGDVSDSKSGPAASIFEGARWTPNDHMPFIGFAPCAKAIQDQSSELIKHDKLVIPSAKQLLLNSGHGSRGLLSGIGGAIVIGDLISKGSCQRLPTLVNKMIDPNRYVRRVLRKSLQ